MHAGRSGGVIYSIHTHTHTIYLMACTRTSCSPRTPVRGSSPRLVSSQLTRPRASPRVYLYESSPLALSLQPLALRRRRRSLAPARRGARALHAQEVAVAVDEQAGVHALPLALG